MPQFVFAWATWLRHRLPWSNSRQAWAERLAGAALLTAAVALLWFGGGLAPSRRVLLWGLLLVAAAGLLRRGWVQLFGPVLFYELLRIGRRGRYIAVRCLYVLALLVFLLFVYAVWRDAVLIAEGTIAQRDLANFAASFFYVFALLQLSVVYLLTPAYTAGALAEEKERGTLEALLATDLRGREIVLGLFLARLANLTLLLLAGLPVLSFLQFVGGVDPNLVVSSFAATGCTMVSLASVSFLCSLYARRSRDAIVRSYLLSVGFLVLSGLSWLLLVPQLQLAAFPSTETFESPVTLEDVVRGVNGGNIFSVVVQLVLGVEAGGALNDLLWDSLTEYAWIHGLIAAGCCVWAVLRLRTKALAQLAGDSNRRRRPARVRLGLRLLRDWPMLWKEVVVEASGQRGLLRLLVDGCLLAVLAVPVLHVIYYYGRLNGTDPRDTRLIDLINLWVRGASMLLGSLLLLQVAVRAAGSMSGERGRQTLDGLLATPLSNREILAGKWLGSILGPRRPWLGLAVVWCVGLATGALHPLAPLAFVLAWLVFAGFLASLGLWASVANRSTHGATFWTLFLLGAAVLASWLAAFDTAGRWLSEPEALSLSPPLALGLLVFSSGDIQSWADPRSQWSFQGILLGLAFWGVAAVALWKVTLVRFRIVTGREAEIVGRAEDGSALPLVTGRPPVASVETPSRKASDPEARPPEPVPPHRVPLRRWLGPVVRTAVVLVPLGLLVGEYVRLDGKASHDLRDTIAEVERLDPDWQLEALEAARQGVPAEQNSALQVLQAAALVPSDWWKMQPELLFDKLSPDRQLNADQQAVLRKGMTLVGAALTEARRLADMPHGRYPLLVKEKAPQAIVYGHGQEPFVVGGVLGHDADLRSQDGDADGALASCRALLNAGRSIGDEPQLFAQLMRRTLRLSTVLKMERALAQGEPTEATLEPLQRLLTDEDRFPLLLIALRGERAGMDRMLASMQEGSNDQPHFFEIQRGPAAVAPFPQGEELRLLASGSLKDQRGDMLRLFTECVEAARLPPDQMDARITGLATKARPGAGRPPAVWSFVLNPAQSQQYLQTLALGRAGIAALATERYRRQFGQWPHTLDALVPAFLAEVPADPYDGKPLRYRRVTNGVVLYSVGADLTDNGGKLDRQSRVGGGVDVGVQLWDVDQRRQPARPIPAKAPAKGVQLWDLNGRPLAPK
jgi:ABC-type transport system involved in multi-copper enzyme maturation permease subunit